MYNFLDPKLSPKVHSSAISLDNYEVTNLISENFSEKSRGFSAYCNARPPIHITFELICPINVHYMILWTTLGIQKCTALEIFAKTDNNNKEFNSISAVADFNTDGIVFCNSRIYSVNNLPENIDKNFHLVFFRNSAFRSFTAAKIVKVLIKHSGQRAPCLGRIEIWGKPSKICSPTTINTINHLMQKEIKLINQNLSKLEAQDTQSVEEWQIPEEFKDSLTYEVMAIPITLPSGNAIDQSTLEKYIQNEANYGRSASDPFTGRKFTDNHKPVFNAALKARIDMFLLKNSSKAETFTVKRTLGNKINSLSELNVKCNSRKRESENFINNKEIKKSKVSDTSEHTVNRNVNYNDLDEKLNEAINKTINSNGFMSFTNEESKVDDVKKISECVRCKEINNLYVIPCSHLYCRTCLLDICKRLICEECKIMFNKNDPKRFHGDNC